MARMQATADGGRPPIAKHVPYAKCQLFLGEFEFPSAEGLGKSEGTSKPCVRLSVAFSPAELVH